MRPDVVPERFEERAHLVVQTTILTAVLNLVLDHTGSIQNVERTLTQTTGRHRDSQCLSVSFVFVARLKGPWTAVIPLTESQTGAKGLSGNN
jgi:hypothetical protein